MLISIIIFYVISEVFVNDQKAEKKMVKKSFEKTIEKNGEKMYTKEIIKLHLRNSVNDPQFQNILIRKKQRLR